MVKYMCDSMLIFNSTPHIDWPYRNIVNHFWAPKTTRRTLTTSPPLIPFEKIFCILLSPERYLIANYAYSPLRAMCKCGVLNKKNKERRGKEHIEQISRKGIAKVGIHKKASER